MLIIDIVSFGDEEKGLSSGFVLAEMGLRC
jgi:hypothetical protein